MNVFFLFAPAFRHWPLEIARELEKLSGGLRLRMGNQHSIWFNQEAWAGV